MLIILLIENKNVQIKTLEDSMAEQGTQIEYHGDCSSVNNGEYTCDDTIMDNAGSVEVTCTDGEILQLYCNPASENSNCENKPVFPFGGPINGQEACEGA